MLLPIAVAGSKGSQLVAFKGKEIHAATDAIKCVPLQALAFDFGTPAKITSPPPSPPPSPPLLPWSQSQPWSP
jgi:hypothetical protein